MLVTKAATQLSLGQEIGKQVLASRRPIMTGAIILGAMVLVPGLPKIPFIALSAILAWYANQSQDEEADAEEDQAQDAPPAATPEEQLLDDFVQTDRACVELGARLIGLVQPHNSKGLADRVPSLRRDLTRQYGFWIPAVRIRDNTQLPAESYQILVNGRPVARGELRPDKCLALNAEGTQLNVDGEATMDPTFGLPATWIQPSYQRRVEMAGHTVVDAAGVLVTHLGETLRRYAHELLSREDMQQLLDKLKEMAPTIVGEIKPDTLRPSVLHQVLVLLLEERVPITDLERIVESALSHAVHAKDPVTLTELVRQELGRSICDPYCDDRGRVRVVVLKPRLESALRAQVQNGELGLAAQQLEKLVSALNTEMQKGELNQSPVACLTDSSLRRPLRRAVQRSLIDLSVVAYNEVPQDMMIEPVRVLDVSDVFEETRTVTPANGPQPINDFEQFEETNDAGLGMMHAS